MKVKERVGPIEDANGDLIYDDSLTTHIFNDYVSSVFTEEDLEDMPNVLTYIGLFVRLEHRPSTMSVCGHFLHFSPGVSQLLSLVLGVSLSGVSWPSSSSLPSGVPSK